MSKWTGALLFVFLGLLAAAPGEAQTTYPGIDTSRVFLYPGPCQVRSGTGSPEGAVVGNPCDLYLRIDGGAGVLFYRKESGTKTNTGWENTVSKSSVNAWTVAQTFAGDVRHPSFASQTSNWGITAGGAGDFRYLWSDELRIRIFSAEETAVYRSALWVTKSHSEVSQAFTCPAYSGTATLWVRDAGTIGDARVFSTNDWIQIQLETRTDSDLDGNQELAVGTCRGTVTTYVDGTGANAGQQSWSFTRAISPDGGTMAGSSVIPAGALAIDLGILNANGAVVLSAYDGAEGINAPYVQTQLWTGASGSVGHSPRCRLGNLRGAYGYSATIFGLACGDPAGTRITIEPTNGIRLMKPDGTVVLQADASGNLSMTGTFTVTGGNAATTSYVDTAEADAVAAAATDATTKANAAAAASLDKVTYLDTTTIRGGMITTGSITATQIAATTITGAKIAAGTITADKMSVSSLSAISAVLGTVAVSGASSLSGGDVTIDTSGIRIAPTTGAWPSITAGQMYRFTNAFTGDTGAFGVHGSASTVGSISNKHTALVAINDSTQSDTRAATSELYAQFGAFTGDPLMAQVIATTDNTGASSVTLRAGNATPAVSWITVTPTAITLNGSGAGAAVAINGGLSFTPGGTSAAGGLRVDATYGFSVRPYTGSTADFAIGNQAASALVALVPTGTDDWSFGASTLVAVPTVGASVTTGICTNASSVLIACPSDARLKRSVKPYAPGLAAIRRLRPVAFNWTEASGFDTTKPMAGFIAQQVRDVMPDATATTTDGYLTVDDRALIAALVNAVQQQQTQIEALEKEVRALKGRR